MSSEGQGGAAKARRLGRYLVHRELASGGMASVYLGRLIGPAGFARPVAIKRLHEHLAKIPEFVTMFLDEAHIAARVQHPNVVPTLDVVAVDGELFLVMEFILGESLARLLATLSDRNEQIPVPIAAAIATGTLLGLHAAHEATNEEREPLSIIHRDVSPQNILLGVDGTPRVADFGVAKALGRLQTTREGQVKGKLAYMPPEQVREEVLDRRADIYAASVVFWEMLSGERLYQGEAASIVYQILEANVPLPSSKRGDVPKELDDVIRKGLAPKREDRYRDAREMVEAIERAVTPATSTRIARWLSEIAGSDIEARSKLVAELEATDPDAPPITSRPSDEALAARPESHGDAPPTPRELPRTSPKKGADELAGYVLKGKIGEGGMAAVHVAQKTGEGGFQKTVAIKRMNAAIARDKKFRDMFLDEARLAARIQHPSVVPTLDVVARDDELFIVMDYVRGASLASLRKSAIARGERVPVEIARAVLLDALDGLHAAHEATDDEGAPLGIVHRDVSPHNVLVGVDGTARITDFGIAMANQRLGDSTVTGEIKGKATYMAPEQIASADDLDRRVDVFAAGVVLWELLAGRRLFQGATHQEIFEQITRGTTPRLHVERDDVSEELDRVLGRATARARDERYGSAEAFAKELEATGPRANKRAIRDWVLSLAGEEVAERDAMIQGKALRLDARPSSGSGSNARAERSASRGTDPPTDTAGGTATPNRASPEPRVSRAWIALGSLAVGATLALAMAYVRRPSSESPTLADGTRSVASAPPIAPSARRTESATESATAAPSPSASASAAPSLAASAAPPPKRELRRDAGAPAVATSTVTANPVVSAPPPVL